jgi:hypothetical protein
MTARWPQGRDEERQVNVPLQWVWENDPEDLPDDDNARCISAHGERYVVCGGQLFALTTRPCVGLSASPSAYSRGSFSTLQMEYLGLDWGHGLARQSWGCDPFQSGPMGGKAQQAAGVALLATIAGELAGSALRQVESSSSLDEFDDRRRPQPPPQWRSRGRAPRPRQPALLPLTVCRGGDDL